MDFTKYLECRDTGMVSRQKIGTVWVFVVRQFNPQTGVEMAPNVLQVNPEQIKTDIEKLKNTLANLEALYEDITVVK